MSKEYDEKVKAYEGHCIEEKVAFINLMKEQPWLLPKGDNRLRYNIYLEEFLDYKHEQLMKLLDGKKVEIDYLENKRKRQLKEKRDNLNKIKLSTMYSRGGNSNK